MALFKKFFKNKVNLNDQSVQLDDVLLSALLNNETITREKALTLPAVSGAVDFISGSIAACLSNFTSTRKTKLRKCRMTAVYEC